MRLACAGAPHLTYCTNIHPGETWAEVKQSLETHLLEIWSRAAGHREDALRGVGGAGGGGAGAGGARGGGGGGGEAAGDAAPGERPRCGVGLRLSARAAAELAAPAELEAFRDFLERNGLYVFTLNGFPYGRFHGAPVKESVYLPDWLGEERLAYSDLLATLLAALLPAEEGLMGSVSTVPGAFRPRVRTPGDAEAIGRRLVRHAAHLVEVRRRTGKRITLALEPEPCCFLETTPEAIGFFTEHVFSSARARELSSLAGMSLPDAEEALRTHLGLCFDACHMAVEFEDAPASLAALRAAGVEVHKVQISAGLRASVAERDPATMARLRAYAEDVVYLHQVVERRGGAGGGELVRYLDLPDALAALEGARGAAPEGRPEEWRVHFHVPIFRGIEGALGTTQPELAALLSHLRDRPATQHLEVETYTWDVLPEDQRRGGVVEAVARELRWVEARMVSGRAGAGGGAGAGAGADAVSRVNGEQAAGAGAGVDAAGRASDVSGEGA
ncbi:metabolite traffic protein EboE [Sorangium sp. So ce1182]|uniref:metabolite traffic protein EboE n=1 Tax=Sorangium sp. So ce1182 TaxID=3133334 RepID=UPI003F5F1D30